MTKTVVNVGEIPKLAHAEAMAMAKEEYERFGELIGTLSDVDWQAATDCDRWKVKNIVSHVTAMSQAVAEFPAGLLRQQRAAKRQLADLGLPPFDTWTEYQARLHEDDPELLRRYAEQYPRVLRRRQRFPKLLRPVRYPNPPYGWWSFRYLLDDILTRDVWMHRVDVSRSAGRDLALTAEHDGRFVANLVRELASNWRRTFTLTLTGTAGGSYVNGSGGPAIELDAVEFCRILSGRSSGHGLPTDAVPF